MENRNQEDKEMMKQFLGFDVFCRECAKGTSELCTMLHHGGSI